VTAEAGRRNTALCCFKDCVVQLQLVLAGEELEMVMDLVCAICEAFSVLLRLQIPLGDGKTS
jgi:hypothetical protein